MTIILQNFASKAEDAAAGFIIFRQKLPDRDTEFTGLIADLYAISLSLKRLEELMVRNTRRRILDQMEPDLELVCNSLQYTLEDIIAFFGHVDAAPREVYRRVWDDMSVHFLREGQCSLSVRLDVYTNFLQGIEDMVVNKCVLCALC